MDKKLFIQLIATFVVIMLVIYRVERISSGAGFREERSPVDAYRLLCVLRRN